MACGCQGSAGLAGRALRTSGDYAQPVPEPMLLVPPGEDAVAPEGARYVVYDAPQGTAFFEGHGDAFTWQKYEGGGRLRTV